MTTPSELLARQVLAGVKQRTGDASLDREADAASTPRRIMECYHCQDRKRIYVGGDAQYRRCPSCNPEPFASGTPLEFEEATFENYRRIPGNAAALALAMAFLDGSRDLYLFGKVGAGKTALACRIGNAAHIAKRSVRFVRVSPMLSHLEPSRDADDRHAFERTLERVSVLVLDDLGAERDRATDFSRRVVLDLFEARSDRGLRTVFTSNLSLEKLAQQQGDARLASRIGGRCDVVEITCRDQRLVR